MLCYKYAGLNIVTKSINCNIWLLIAISRIWEFLSRFSTFKVKIWNHSYPSAASTEKTAIFQGWGNIITTPRYHFAAPKNLDLALVLFHSIQNDWQKPAIIFVSGKFSEKGTGSNKRTDYPRLWNQHLMQVGVYFGQAIQSNIYCDQADKLQ